MFIINYLVLIHRVISVHCAHRASKVLVYLYNEVNIAEEYDDTNNFKLFIRLFKLFNSYNQTSITSVRNKLFSSCKRYVDADAVYNTIQYKSKREKWQGLNPSATLTEHYGRKIKCLTWPAVALVYCGPLTSLRCINSIKRWLELIHCISRSVDSTSV